VDHRNLYDVIVHIAHSRSTAIPALAAATQVRHDAKQPERVEAAAALDEGPAAPVPDPIPTRLRRDLRWGTPEFAAASDLARRMSAGHRGLTLAKALTRGGERRALVASYRAPSRPRASDAATSG